MTQASGVTPFGFEFTPSGYIVVSEAFGGNDGEGAVSSYAADANGNLTVVSGSVPDGQSAACWMAITGDGRFAYTTNAASNNISGYHVAEDGTLTLFDDNGVTAALEPDSGPLDMAVSNDQQYLYVLVGRMDTIIGYSIGDDGALTLLPGSVDVLATANGLVGY